MAASHQRQRPSPGARWRRGIMRSESQIAQRRNRPAAMTISKSIMRWPRFRAARRCVRGFSMFARLCEYDRPRKISCFRLKKRGASLAERCAVELELIYGQSIVIRLRATYGVQHVHSQPLAKSPQKVFSSGLWAFLRRRRTWSDDYKSVLESEARANNFQ